MRAHTRAHSDVKPQSQHKAKQQNITKTAQHNTTTAQHNTTTQKQERFTIKCPASAVYELNNSSTVVSAGQPRLQEEDDDLVHEHKNARCERTHGHTATQNHNHNTKQNKKRNKNNTAQHNHAKTGMYRVMFP
jgi:hypothetical protein